MSAKRHLRLRDLVTSIVAHYFQLLTDIFVGAIKVDRQRTGILIPLLESKAKALGESLRE